MQIPIQQKIESIINNLDRLPSIPEVATKVISMVNNPSIAFKLVADEISKDQAITANILKLCNSAYFNRGKEITSVERAIVTMGMKEVKDMVIVATSKSVLDKAVIGYNLDKGEMWNHGLAVAVLSKDIVMKTKKKDIADIAFTGGIIHDVGKTVIALFVQSTFKEILKVVEEDQIPFEMAEKKVMGFDHQEIGEKILAKWKFPEVLKAITRFHHEPGNAPNEFKFIVSAVHIANVICLMAGIGIGSDGLYHELNESALAAVGLKSDDLDELYANAPELLQKTQAIQ